MSRTKRPDAAISGANIARTAAIKAGNEIREARKRRRLTLAALAQRAGIGRSRLAEIELGAGGGAPLEVWFAISRALDRYLRFEFARDPMSELADAGHLAIQELVIRIARAAGWEVQFEAPTKPWESRRSVDVRLVDRRRRQIVIVECWNTFGDIGAAARSSNEKVRDAEQQAVAIASGGDTFTVGLVWVVRDTKANRELLRRYAGSFDTRFPGSSAHWVDAISRGSDFPAQPGLIWCDVNRTRLFARRSSRIQA